MNRFEALLKIKADQSHGPLEPRFTKKRRAGKFELVK
jgi:hypothetical protein